MAPVLTLPNLLTIGRIVLVPLVVWQITAFDLQMAFWLFLAAALTDLLDGSLARWLDQRTVLGAWLDPIADKLMLLSSLFSLVWVGILPGWLALIVVMRDAIILIGAAAYRILTGHLEIAPMPSGKLAIFVEFTLVCTALGDVAFGLGLASWLTYLSGMTALVVVVSGIRYIIAWTDKTQHYLQNRQAQSTRGHS